MTNLGSSSCDAITGMRFHPLDEELINYLLKFVSGKPYECDHIRDNVDLYGNKKPYDIFDELSTEGETTDVNYFFTQLKSKSVDGKNCIRTMVGGGTWKGLDGGKDVLDKFKRSTIGLKKTFRFDDRNDEDQKYAWRMEEYCLSGRILTALRKRGQIRHENFVLCRIKRKLVDQKKRLLWDISENISAGFMCSNIPMEISSNGDEIIIPMVGCVEDQNQYVDSSCVPVNYMSEDDQFHLLMKDQVQGEGFCANNNYEEVQNMNAGLSGTLHQKKRSISMCSGIITSSGDENIVVTEQLGCLEDYNYVPTRGLEEGFCANNNISRDDHQFQQQEEEFERAKASVPPVEETLPELSNLSNGNEDFQSLLSTLLQTKSDINDPIMSQMPHLISTDDQFFEQATMMSSNGLPIMSDQFQICCDQMQLGNYETELAEYCFPMDHIHTVEDLSCSHTQIYEPLIDDQLTIQGDESSVGTLAGEVNYPNDIASYHKALDSYAASQLQRHPLSVPEATPLLDQRLTFSQDYCF